MRALLKADFTDLKERQIKDLLDQLIWHKQKELFDKAVVLQKAIGTDFNKEVAPHVADAWIDAGKRDARDGGVGMVGYEIPFNRHFYQYEPPRDLAEIDADLDALSAEIMEMLREVNS